MTPMTFAELRLASAELRAMAAMRAEREQAERDAELVKALARRRCTVRLSRWLDSERAAWRRHVELQRSLRALRRESPVRQSTVRIVSALAVATTCPACQDRRM